MNTSQSSANDDENIKAFKDGFDDDAKNDTRYNLAVVGLTGAGKSTLVNAVFEADLARTGTGEPVTRGVNYYPNTTGTLGLYDFEGIETGQDLAFVIDKFRNEFTKRLAGDPAKMIHGVWYCVRSSDLRFEQGQAEIVKDLASLDIPVFLVLTRVPRRPTVGVDPKVTELAESIFSHGLPIVTGRPFLVNALVDDFNDLPVHGLEALLESTYESAPEGVKAALAAAQRVSRDKKRKTANQAITAAASTSALVGLAPTPGADSLAIIPIQAAMMRKVARVYQLDMTAATLASTMGTMAVTFAGKTAYTALLKLVPGWGNAAAGFISGSFTYALGAAWHQLCIGISDGDIDASILSDNKELGEALLNALKEQLERLRKRQTGAQGQDSAT